MDIDICDVLIGLICFRVFTWQVDMIDTLDILRVWDVAELCWGMRADCEIGRCTLHVDRSDVNDLLWIMYSAHGFDNVCDICSLFIDLT
jgi:hypothetical protein